MLLEYPLDTMAGRVWRWKLLRQVVCWRAMDRVAAAKERIVSWGSRDKCSGQRGDFKDSLGPLWSTSITRQLVDGFKVRIAGNNSLGDV